MRPTRPLAVFLAGCALLGASAPCSAATVLKGLVILAAFCGSRQEPARELGGVRFNQHLNAYVREMSYGAVALQADVMGQWRVLPEPVERYRISPRNLEVDKSRVRRLIDDALAAVERDVDFAKYDFTVVYLAADVQEYGMVGLCGYPGMLGWSEAGSLKTPGGQAVRGGVAIFCRQAHLGTLFHDVAHILGGVKDGRRRVPCLYDHDLQAKPGPPQEVFANALVNMGYWDPMSCHFYRRTLPPPGISSWTRMRLGWLPEAKVRVVGPGQRADVPLGPLNDGASDVLCIRIPLSPEVSYLVENRQPVGFDRNLPGKGILVMYADDRVAECRQGKAPVRLANADSALPRLEGAAFEVGKKPRFTDVRNGVDVELLGQSGGSVRVRVVRTDR